MRAFSFVIVSISILHLGGFSNFAAAEERPDECKFEYLTWKYYSDKRCENENKTMTEAYNKRIKDFS